MKKRIVLSFLFSFAILSISLFAQGEGGDRQKHFEKFKADREAFINKAMKLTDEEQKAFWPLCNELQMKKFEAGKELREERKKLRESREAGKSISEADYKRLIELNADIKIKEAELEKEYMSKFMKVIPAEKVFLYQRAEQDFGRQMMEGQNRNRQARPTK